MQCPICNREMLEITNAWDERWYRCEACDYVIEFYEDRQITIEDVFQEYATAYEEFEDEEILRSLAHIVSLIQDEDVRATYQNKLRAICGGRCDGCSCQ